MYVHVYTCIYINDTNQLRVSKCESQGKCTACCKLKFKKKYKNACLPNTPSAIIQMQEQTTPQ